MKKIMAAIIVIIQAILLCSCECSHEYAPAVCGQFAQCEKCGEFGGSLGECDYLPATCTEAGKCSICGRASGEKALGHDYSVATASKPSVCKRCNEPKKPTGSELGYNYFDDMGYSLVEITSYFVDRFNHAESYVTVTGDTYLFDDGVLFSKDFELTPGRVNFGYAAYAEDTYSISDNDNLILGGGSSYHKIIERETYRYRDDFVAFVIEIRIRNTETKWFVPYSLIDWDRGISLSPKPANENVPEYILYLKEPV